MASIEGKARGQRHQAQALPRRPRLGTICLVFLSFVSAVFLLRYAQAVILPVVLSLLLFYALDPVVCWISGIGIPRVVACIAVIFILLGSGGFAIYLLRGQAGDLVERLPEAMTKAKTAIEAHRGRSPGAVAKVQQAAGELQQSASEAARTKPPTGVTRVEIEEPLFDHIEELKPIGRLLGEGNDA